MRLNYPETVALLSTWVIERAREGASVHSLMSEGCAVLSRDQVMTDVADMLTDVQVEATFPDGRKLVTLHQPIASYLCERRPVDPRHLRSRCDSAPRPARSS